MPAEILLNQVVIASGNTASFQSDSFGTITANIMLAAVGGTAPSFMFQLQGSPDGATWFNVGAPSSGITSNGGTTLASAPGAFDAAFARVLFTVTGTLPTANVEIWMDGR